VGSTLALVTLCNQLNQDGRDCIFYGPDRWHLDQCRGAGINDFKLEPGDRIIIQGVRLYSASDLECLAEKVTKPSKKAWLQAMHNLLAGRLSRSIRPADVKLVLSCQEEDDGCLRRSQYALFDQIHYLSKTQISFRAPNHDHFVCDNLCGPLKIGREKPVDVAGVIGSIRKENKTHESIQRALQDGIERVLLYGYLADPLYFYSKIEPLTKKYRGRIRFVGFLDSRQKMYDSISDVYCRPRKSWSLIEKECGLTGTRYHGPTCSGDKLAVTDDEILGAWRRALA
jgi:hypothetical protein